MQIHTTKANQSLKEIAELYGVREEALRKINEIPSGEPAEGEELLIILPTRDYKVQYGDTAERISLRFDIPMASLHLQNPWISGRPLITGEFLTIKSTNAGWGMAGANGYFYKGCDKERLATMLPYLTYVTFVSAMWNGKEIKRIFDDKKEISYVSGAGRLPLLRICIDGASIKNLPSPQAIIEYTKEGGYKGVVLSTGRYVDSASDFSSFLVDLRKIMIGCDLILITEINESSPSEFSEYSDGSLMYYPKYAFDSAEEFDKAERRIFSDFAIGGESAKTFIDLPALAKCKNGYMEINEALSCARRRKNPIKHNKNTLLSHFADGKQGEIIFCSLSYIKEVLKIIKELDYMGVCFDIMRTPISHLMMYSSMFRTSYASDVRSREGCSRADEV